MKKALKFMIPGIILLITLILIIARARSNKIPSNSEYAIGNLAGNLMNGGYFCESDGTIYFANPYDSNRLYSMTTDCQNIKKISDDQVSYINVAGDYIYYIRNNAAGNDISVVFRDDLFGVVRCKTDGSDVKVLSKDQCTDLALSGDTLVFDTAKKDVYTICSMGTNGKNKKELHPIDIDNSSFANKSIYFSGNTTNHAVHIFDISDKSITLYLEGNTFKATVVGDSLYYIDLDNNYALTKYDMIKKTTSVLAVDKCINFNVYDDMVYFQTENDKDSHALMRVHTDGTGKELVMTGDISRIHCTSTYTFMQPYGTDTLYFTPTKGNLNVVPIMFDLVK